METTLYGHAFEKLAENVVRVHPPIGAIYDSYFYKGISLSQIERQAVVTGNESDFWESLRPYEISAYRRESEYEHYTELFG